jgi:DNA-binding transcriptional regulator YiaG
MSDAAISERAFEDLLADVRAIQLPRPSERQRIRTRAGLSLRAVAEALGVDPMTIWRWERGRQPRREHAIRYRRLLEALEEAVQ